MSSNLHIAWARLFFGGLADAEVRHVVVSPGSRSTPLVFGAVAEPRLSLDVVIDERSAAFFALGQARVTGEPTALVCTSGSAAGHYLPAIMEASEAGLPLVVVTADRPWEAQHVGAPQTLDQTKMFGSFARLALELGLPDEAALEAPARIAAQAASVARGPRPGPVHVNARFRKPLEPQGGGDRAPWPEQVEPLATRPRAVFSPLSEPSPAGIEALAQALAEARAPLFALGPGPTSRAPDGPTARAAAELAERAAWLIDATSGFRFGPAIAGCHGLEAVLASPRFRAENKPDLIVELGSGPTATVYASYLAEHPGAKRFVLSDKAWCDPSSTADALLLGDPWASLRALAKRLEGRAARPEALAFRASFLRAEAVVRGAVCAALEGDTLGEAVVAREVVGAIPAEGALFVSNSMPIRDVDLFSEPTQRRIAVVHQRGVNGIDGLIAGFAGAERALPRPALLLLGDVAFLHDIGSLASLRGARAPSVVVVVDNGGGRIFDELPIAEQPAFRELVDRYFVTPPGVAIEHAAAAFSIPCRTVETRAALREALREALTRDGATMIVARVPPGAGSKLRAALRRRVAEQLGAEGERL